MKENILALVLIACVAGCKDGGEMTEKFRAKKDEPVKEYCLGRHIFAMPGVFSPASITTGVFHPGAQRTQDPSIDVVVQADLTRQGFETEIQKRRTQLKESDNDNVDVLRLEKLLKEDTILFRIQQIDDAYVSEVRALRGKHSITVRLESYRQQFLAAEEQLIKFVDAVKVDNEARSSPGFCLGPLTITGDFEVEKGSFLFEDGQGADFEVEIDTYSPDDPTPLLARLSGPDSLLKIFKVDHTVLRSREKTIAGMRAQEWLAWARLGEDESEKTMKFTLETMRAKPSRFSPSINVTFNTLQPLKDGTPPKPRFSDVEAMQLWDAVVDSIRPVGNLDSKK